MRILTIRNTKRIMTYRQLLEEGRVCRVSTYKLPFYYWNVYGEKKLDKEPRDWEDSFMTEEEAIDLRASLWNVPFVRVNYCTNRLTDLAAREDPNDARSIYERPMRERTLPEYRPPRKRGGFRSLLPNMIVGIPLMIFRAALKH